jgi:Glu-tRNA(Gln) amidotransferase subunit E-like FAD-binding protein
MIIRVLLWKKMLTIVTWALHTMQRRTGDKTLAISLGAMVHEVDQNEGVRPTYFRQVNALISLLQEVEGLRKKVVSRMSNRTVAKLTRILALSHQPQLIDLVLVLNREQYEYLNLVFPALPRMLWNAMEVHGRTRQAVKIFSFLLMDVSESDETQVINNFFDELGTEEIRAFIKSLDTSAIDFLKKRESLLIAMLQRELSS